MNTWLDLKMSLSKNKTINKNIQEQINKEKDHWKKVLLRIIVVVSILMSFPADYVMYIFNCAFTNRFFLHYGYFLASLHIGSFFFLFQCLYLS